MKIKLPETIILSKTGLNCIGSEQEPYFDQNVIKEYADSFREKLLSL
jgi:dethiobiotin synthetase